MGEKSILWPISLSLHFRQRVIGVKPQANYWLFSSRTVSLHQRLSFSLLSFSQTFLGIKYSSLLVCRCVSLYLDVFAILNINLQTPIFPVLCLALLPLPCQNFTLFFFNVFSLFVFHLHLFFYIPFLHTFTPKTPVLLSEALSFQVI